MVYTPLSSVSDVDRWSFRLRPLLPLGKDSLGVTPEIDGLRKICIIQRECVVENVRCIPRVHAACCAFARYLRFISTFTRGEMAQAILDNGSHCVYYSDGQQLQARPPELGCLGVHAEEAFV